MSDSDARNMTQSRGVKSIEVGYRVLLAVQRGPDAVQLTEIAKRSELSRGAAHNYLSSLMRTGLVEQDGRGRYRLGPSAFALSLNSFRQLNGLEVMRREAMDLHQQTGQSTAVAVWSQAGPISVFTLRAESLGTTDFRPGRLPMLDSGAGLVFAAYLHEEDVIEPLRYELEGAGSGKKGATAFILRARREVVPKGYGFYTRPSDDYFVLTVPIWGQDHRIPFVLSLLSKDSSISPKVNIRYVDLLLAASGRTSALLEGSGSIGPTTRARSSARHVIRSAQAPDRTA